MMTQYPCNMMLLRHAILLYLDSCGRTGNPPSSKAIAVEVLKLLRKLGGIRSSPTPSPPEDQKRPGLKRFSKNI